MKHLALALTVLAGAASAAPESSQRPVERPVERVPAEPSKSTKTAVQDADALRPKSRPATIAAPKPVAKAPTAARVVEVVTTSKRPKLRPQTVRRAGREQQRMRRAGAVCGDTDIQGEVVGRVPGRIAGCGIPDAVRVRAVSGIALSHRALMDCTTAKALKSWVDNTARPVLRKTGGGLKTLRVAAHYACRTRNNQPGGRISEHGKGRAIDISAVQLKDGSTITVLRGWNAASTSKIMRQLHKGACGPFGTVLGPDGDRFHKDHFHFDTARHRSGKYCR